MSALVLSYKNLGKFLDLCLNTFLSLLKVLYLSSTNIKLPKAETDSCIILGNGPSLNISLQKYPEFFRNHPLICVNAFSISEQYTDLKPAYYMMLDPGLWLSDADIIKQIFSCIKDKTDWPLFLFVPRITQKYKHITDLEIANKNIKIIYFNYTIFKGFKNLSHAFFKRNLAMPQSQNVLVASLFLAINMGFKKLYLFGADHTWHQNLYLNEENVVCVKNSHFYENEEHVSIKPFFKGHHLKETFKMHEVFLALTKTFQGYWILNDYAKSRNCTIYNASEVSFIDAFEYVKL